MCPMRAMPNGQQSRLACTLSLTAVCVWNVYIMCAQLTISRRRAFNITQYRIQWPKLMVSASTQRTVAWAWQRPERRWKQANTGVLYTQCTTMPGRGRRTLFRTHTHRLQKNKKQKEILSETKSNNNIETVFFSHSFVLFMPAIRAPSRTGWLLMKWKVNAEIPQEFANTKLRVFSHRTYTRHTTHKGRHTQTVRCDASERTTNCVVLRVNLWTAVYALVLYARVR